MKLNDISYSTVGGTGTLPVPTQLKKPKSYNVYNNHIGRVELALTYSPSILDVSNDFA